MIKRRSLAAVAITVATIVLTPTINAGTPNTTSNTSPSTNPVYMAVVDCALPPVSLTAMAGAFSEESILPSFTSLVPGSKGKEFVQATFTKVKMEVKPEIQLKQRLANYFASKFTVAEAQEITSSCAASAGFTNKELFDKFQSVLKTISNEAQKQNVLVTCSFMGRLMTELSKDLETLSPQDLGFSNE